MPGPMTWATPSSATSTPRAPTPTACFGESRHVEGHIIPLTLLVAVGRREKLKIFGGDWDTRDGTCVRDYVHTDDLAQAHQLAVESLEPGVARDYNLGSGTRGRRSSKSSGPARPPSAGRSPTRSSTAAPGDPGTLIATPEKVIRELGWSPKYTPTSTSIVATAWRWHESHPDTDGYGSKAH